MESGEIINNSYKDFGERESNQTTVGKNKFGLKKVIIISVIISIIIAVITFVLIYIYIIKKEDEIVCEPGYFLPDNNPKECAKCSTENCKTCRGTKDKNECTMCLPGFLINYSVCEIEHSLKTIYFTEEKDTTISLMHYMYVNNIKKMIVDNEIIVPNSEYTFKNNGSHIVYITFDNELETLGELFYGIEELIEANFTYLFDTSKITSFSYMFYSCKNLEKINISYFNTSNVEIMSGMFQLCSSLTSINISNFDTINVNSMSTMFMGCKSLKSLDLSNFVTPNLTSMTDMFENCYNLTSINLENFDTKNVYNFNYLFLNCYSLTSVELGHFDTQKIVYMKGMFQGCTSITSLDLSNFVIRNDTQIDYIFYDCNNLNYLDISGFRSDKTIKIFYGLPSKGKIIIEKNFLELVKDQIPNGWEFIIENQEYVLLDE